MDFYRDTVTNKSWERLQSLARLFRFVLIGGWAVWLWTRRLKSKDIDLVIDFSELAKFREHYTLTKNDRLTKYEAVDGPVSIDIYVPHWSRVGIPAEDLLSMAVSREGLRVVPPEALLVTKLVAYLARAGSSKGRKDVIDIVSLLLLDDFDWQAFRGLANRYRPEFPGVLGSLVRGQTRIPELGISSHAFARAKRTWLAHLI